MITYFIIGQFLAFLPGNQIKCELTNFLRAGMIKNTAFIIKNKYLLNNFS